MSDTILSTPEPTSTRSPHVVHFYDDDRSGMDIVAKFLCAGVLRGDATIVIATQSHQAMIKDALVADGADIDLAIAQERFLMFDARETLTSITEKGKLVKERYEELAKGALSRAANNAPSGKVQAYGEMVALLCEDGAPDTAIELEHCWNELAQQYQFTLFCSYPSSVMMHTNTAALQRICATHTSVILPLSEFPDAQ